MSPEMEVFHAAPSELQTAVINSSATCFALQFASTSTRFDVIHLHKVPSCLSNVLLAWHKNFSYIIQVMRTTKFVIVRTGQKGKVKKWLMLKVMPVLFRLIQISSLLALIMYLPFFVSTDCKYL